MSTPTEITPNVVIRSPQVRLGLGIGLYLLSVAAGIAALVFAFFPEIAAGTDIPTRVIGLVNAVVSLATAAFGLVVTVPNVPRPDASVLLRRDLR
ncbi:hypothetical protein J2Y69_002147 [Microbacterium resistens]|uniref:DUF4386 family protein n=1 Tax=Microbacterium resistens TaxID=156977 RepID=A0ABU1SE63_9MICO|nr:hypothetical protein [Microbacterium resistens]MDR6867543.1 hypothetical protein [Microbacterium resistens]